MLLAALLLTSPGESAFWQYTDSSGQLHVTNEFNSIPVKMRSKATPFVPGTASTPDAEEQPEWESEAAVEQAFREGRLTEAQLESAISSGLLRTSVVGDSYRHALTPQEQAEQRAAERQAGGELDALAYSGSMGTLSTVSVLRAYMQDIRNSDKFWWSLAGQAALVIAAIIVLPFLLRRYHSPETRRIVRASVFFIVIIISATGQLLLFRSETETLGRIMMELGAMPVLSGQQSG